MLWALERSELNVLGGRVVPLGLCDKTLRWGPVVIQCRHLGALRVSEK